MIPINVGTLLIPELWVSLIFPPDISGGLAVRTGLQFLPARRDRAGRCETRRAGQRVERAGDAGQAHDRDVGDAGDADVGVISSVMSDCGRS